MAGPEATMIDTYYDLSSVFIQTPSKGGPREAAKAARAQKQGRIRTRTRICVCTLQGIAMF